ncbi:MAG: hypothetical protein ACFFBD_30055 [Candidatus Hodarchaeota archaeon]
MVKCKICGSPKINLWWSTPLGGAYCSFRCQRAGTWGATLVLGLFFALVTIYFALVFEHLNLIFLILSLLLIIMGIWGYFEAKRKAFWLKKV